MRVLITGHRGYIGAVLVPTMLEQGFDVIGLDTDLYAGCDFPAGGTLAAVPDMCVDLRDVTADLLEGFDAIVHLAALSNDPLGDLAPEHTYAINLDASVRLAELAHKAGVARFVYSSSCSIYGAAATVDEALDESAPFNPVTPYGDSKVGVEAQLTRLTSEAFAPTSIRNATAYGVSPRLRMDLVLNELVASAHETGLIVVKSDGTPWRPLVHIRDICAAIVAVLQAPVSLVGGQAFNIGRSDENYQVRELAEVVAAAVPGSAIRYAEGGGPDRRSYRVNFDRAHSVLQGFQPLWTVRRGIDELLEAFRANGAPVLGDARYIRLRRLKARLADGTLEETLRPRPAVLTR